MYKLGFVNLKKIAISRNSNRTFGYQYFKQINRKLEGK
jgi:hypothetical protein